MTNSIPKQKLPLRVVLHRVGEAILHQYAASRNPLDSLEAAFSLWQEVVAADPSHEPEKEHLVAVLLNTKLRLIAYHVVNVGSLNEAVAHPCEIFRAAILAGAYAFMLIHNHPPGDPTPSKADRRLTRRTQEGAKIIDIHLLDHVVIGTLEEEHLPYFSFQKSGLL